MSKPTMIAYSVKKREGKDDIWTRIGAGFPHNNSNGLTIMLDARPIDDRIVLTEAKAENGGAQ